MWSISGLFLIAVIIGFIIVLAFLEIFLSNRSNKWLGLFLPTLSFFGSFMPLLCSPIKDMGTMIGLFVLLNVPTVIYLLIFLACREKLKLNFNSKA